VHLPRRSRRKGPPERVARNNRAGSGSRRRAVPLLGALPRGPGASLIVGLGNPGRKYRGTRHNAGRQAADRVLDKADVLARGKWPGGHLTLAAISGKRFLVLQPETYMNLSGRSVAPLLDRYGLKPEQMIVIHDDIDLPLGEVRTKQGGGTGGHRGLGSLESVLGERGFQRVRIGVGRPPEGVDPADYVLSPFEDAEKETAERAIEQAASVALASITGTGNGS